MNINDRISKIIEYSGYTSSEFADEIDVQRSSISHITSGRNKPSLEFVIKIKNRFPEINWDWIILGIGEMNKSVSPTSENTAPHEDKSFQDLFTLIDEDYKNEIFQQESRVAETPRDFPIPSPSLKKENLSDSQRLEVQENLNKIEETDNQQVTNNGSASKLQKIVFFYENGKFEVYEP